MVPPNFFIIGAPKCGTTALAQYLSEHPNVFISTPKEPVYFDFDVSKQYQPKWDEYLSYFKDADPSVHKAVGEGSTSYLVSKRAVPEILAFNPEARFIVMLRNPIDLVYAFHSELLFRGIENIPDFEKAWRLEKERVKGRHLPPLCLEKDRLRYSETGKLGEQMERLLSLVRGDKLLVIVYDDFIEKTAEVYQDTLKFLGVSPDARNEFPRVNENKDLRWAWVQQYLAFIATGVWKIKNHFKMKKSFGVLTGLMKLNRKIRGRKGLRQEFRAELVEFFRADVEKLGRLLGRDFSNWLYPWDGKIKPQI